MPSKRERQAAIMDMIGGRAIASQEELRKLLRQRGWDVTQSTLSRDLRELGVARVPEGETFRYAAGHGRGGEGGPTLDSLLPELFAHVDGVGELVVLHTLPGGAQAIARALDSEDWPDVMGTIGGDDTILLVCRTAAARERVARRIRTIAGADTK